MLRKATINDAADARDNSINRTLLLEMAGADLTLSSEQANRNGMIVVTGLLTGERIVTLPAKPRRLAIRNTTTGGQQLRVKYPGNGAEVVIAAGEAVLVHGDGSDLDTISNGTIV